MLTYLQSNELITQEQYGFLSKSSTSMQLLYCFNDWTLSLRKSYSVDVIYFDFAKAFDTVSHPKLIHKLRAYGFCETLIDVLCDFLKNRTQRVVVYDGVSEFHDIISGVHQGSILGPLLFLIYINDIVDLFLDNSVPVSYTHLTLPTIYSV